jgi:hypothetical protein
MLIIYSEVIVGADRLKQSLTPTAMISKAFSLVGLISLAQAGAYSAQASASQWTADAWTSYDSSPTNGFAPVGALNTVGSDAFTTFSHPLYPEYSARIKQTDFCDSTVK